MENETTAGLAVQNVDTYAFAGGPSCRVVDEWPSGLTCRGLASDPSGDHLQIGDAFKFALHEYG